MNQPVILELLSGQLSPAELTHVGESIDTKSGAFTSSSRPYLIELDGKKFTCWGSLDQDGFWEHESIYLGEHEADDWLGFLSDYCEKLVLNLGAICTRRALADEFADASIQMPAYQVDPLAWSRLHGVEEF